MSGSVKRLGSGRPSAAGGKRAARARAEGSAAARTAFTIAELMVVIAIIALILVVGVPAFNAMTTQQRLSKTQQLLNGALTLTHVISVSDRTQAALRICPAEWQLGDSNADQARGRQILTTYTYRATAAADPLDPAEIIYDERFERLEDGPTQLLPPDTWVAPSEALDRVRVVPDLGGVLGDYVLDGKIGHFEFDADLRTNSGERLLDADDFLIVFDPDKGVLGSLMRKPWRLLALDPRSPEESATGQQEVDGERAGNGNLTVPFQRFNFAGVVIYRREPFVALGADADPEPRREVLRRLGQTYYVSRNGGSLVGGHMEGGGED